MISFTPNITKALNSDAIEFFSLVRIERAAHEVDPIPINLYATTSHYNDIQLLVNGSPSSKYNYIADGTLYAVDPPQNSSVVDREQYKIAFADPEFSKRGATEDSLVGRVVECRLGFVDSDPSSPTHGKPFLNIDDTIVVYRGRVDGVSASIKAGGLGESILQITGSSPMRNLDMKKPFFLSREKTKQREPLDTSCDQIYEGSTGIIVKWGRK
jgi:hypothetical protein